MAAETIIQHLDHRKNRHFPKALLDYRNYRTFIRRIKSADIHSFEQPLAAMALVKTPSPSVPSTRTRDGALTPTDTILLACAPTPATFVTVSQCLS